MKIAQNLQQQTLKSVRPTARRSAGPVVCRAGSDDRKV